MTVTAEKRAEILQVVVASLEQGIPLTVAIRDIRAPRRTVYEWLKGDPIVQEAVHLARDLGYDHIAHECIAIADDTSGDVAYDASGFPHPNGAAVLRAKVRIETRLKLLAKWDRRRYGDDKTLKVEGQVEVTQRHVIDPGTLTDDGRAALRALISHAQDQGLIEAQDAEFEEVLDPDEEA